MIARVRWVSIACLAVLTAAMACPAAAQKGASPGRGGIGGLVGASYFYAAEDYSSGARPRFDFAASFRYVFTPSFRVQLSPGFTWSAYVADRPVPFIDERFPTDLDKKDYLTLLTPISFQGQLTRIGPQWVYHLGVGPGLYRVLVEHHRRVLKDPATDRLHRGLYPGFSAELGAERFLKALPSTSIEFAVANHYVFAVRDDQFPSGWNSNLGAVAARVGVNYYFDVNRGRAPSPEVTVPPITP
jgi:hypothetical protein